ncbi:DUF485 domain-containing protein [Streptomyces sp. NPDC001002]
MSFDSSDLRRARQERERAPSSTLALRVPRWAADRQSQGVTTRPRSYTGPHRTLRLLRRACRWQRRVATFAALGYFALFLALTVEVPELMTRPAPGGLPTGLVLALLQLPVTWLAVILYEFTARRYVDPLARRVRRNARSSGATEETRP